MPSARASPSIVIGFFEPEFELDPEPCTGDLVTFIDVFLSGSDLAVGECEIVEAAKAAPVIKAAENQRLIVIPSIGHLKQLNRGWHLSLCSASGAGALG